MTIVRFRFVLSLVGLTMALAALYTEDPRITWAAIAVLLVAFALRFIRRGSDTPPPSNQ